MQKMSVIDFGMSVIDSGMSVIDIGMPVNNFGMSEECWNVGKILEDENSIFVTF